MDTGSKGFNGFGGFIQRGMSELKHGVKPVMVSWYRHAARPDYTRWPELEELLMVSIMRFSGLSAVRLASKARDPIMNLPQSFSGLLIDNGFTG